MSETRPDRELARTRNQVITSEEYQIGYEEGWNAALAWAGPWVDRSHESIRAVSS